MNYAFVMEGYLFVRAKEGFLLFKMAEGMYGDMERVSLSHCIENAVLLDDVNLSEIEEVLLGGKWNETSLRKDRKAIFVKDRDYFRKIDCCRIRWIEASGSYCCIYLKDAPKLVLSFNLKEISEYLPEKIFIRVHRSYIVNVNFIDSFIGNMLCVGEGRIPISKQHKKEVIARLNILGSPK